MANFKINKLELDGVLSLEPKIFEDNRGYFYESFNLKDFRSLVGLNYDFVQDNHSFSKKNVLRGMHFQIKKPQGKLIKVINGEIFDVIVDLRVNSPSFKKWTSIILSSENRKQVWVPPGMAHGFYTISENTVVSYKTTDYWYPLFEKTLIWNDNIIGIDWPLNKTPIISKKDLGGQSFNDIFEFL